MKYPKEFIDFVEKNGSWYYDSGFFVIDKAPEGQGDEVITAEATFLDLEGYMRQWTEDNGYIIDAHYYRSWGEFRGEVENDGMCNAIDGSFKTYEEAFMAAFEKVCELVK